MGRNKKTSKGKQKIEMKKLESEDARHVCFSKRKAGLFLKASELATLCGAEVAILVDSPAGTPYSFGSPAMNPVIARFMSHGLSLPALNTDEAQRLSAVQELNNQCMEMSNQLDAAKKKKAMLEDRLKALVEANQQVRRAENIEELNLAELKQMEQSLYGLKEKIHLAICKNLREGASSSKSVNRSTMMNLSVIGANQIGPSASKVNLFSMANLFEHGETHLGQTLNPIMMQNATTMVHSSEPSVNHPGPNDNTVVNPAETELNLLGPHIYSDNVENPNELEANHHESSGEVGLEHNRFIG